MFGTIVLRGAVLWTVLAVNQSDEFLFLVFLNDESARKRLGESMEPRLLVLWVCILVYSLPHGSDEFYDAHRYFHWCMDAVCRRGAAHDAWRTIEFAIPAVRGGFITLADLRSQPFSDVRQWVELVDARKSVSSVRQGLVSTV